MSARQNPHPCPLPEYRERENALAMIDAERAREEQLEVAHHPPPMGGGVGAVQRDVRTVHRHRRTCERLK
jgi:hypothetical protein